MTDEFLVNETHTVPCRYQVKAGSEVAARLKAETGDTIQSEIDGQEVLTGRIIGELVGVFVDDEG